MAIYFIVGRILDSGIKRRLVSAGRDGLQLRAKKAIGIFFSGHWCPPSRQFTPDLIDAYDHWAKARKFEIVFCSSDQNEEEFWDYFGEMPWRALPFGDAREQTFSQRYGVRGIPSLIIVGPDGQVITTAGLCPLLDLSRVFLSSHVPQVARR